MAIYPEKPIFVMNSRTRDLMKSFSTCAKQDMIFGADILWVDYLKKCTTSVGPKENEMNKIIAAVYEKTADAMLVDKFFNHEIGHSFTNELVLKANKDAYLAEAQRREEEQKKNACGPECVKGTL